MEMADIEEVVYHKGDLVENKIFKERIRRAGELMEKAWLGAILLTSNDNPYHLAARDSTVIAVWEQPIK
jgi:hypothetical protein